MKFQLHRPARPITGARRADPADASRAAPHATAHRRCSAAERPATARPAPQPRVCRIVVGGGNPDPSRDDARDRPVDGRDDRAVLPDSVDGAGAPHGPRRGDRPPGTPLSSRRARDHRRGKSQTAGHTPDTCAPGALTPRGRSAKRASSTIRGDIRQNGSRLIRPAAASGRSRGPGGPAPGPHASLSRGTPYLHPAPTHSLHRQPRHTPQPPWLGNRRGLVGSNNRPSRSIRPDRQSHWRCGVVLFW